MKASIEVSEDELFDTLLSHANADVDFHRPTSIGNPPYHKTHHVNQEKLTINRTKQTHKRNYLSNIEWDTIIFFATPRESHNTTRNNQQSEPQMVHILNEASDIIHSELTGWDWHSYTVKQDSVELFNKKFITRKTTDGVIHVPDLDPFKSREDFCNSVSYALGVYLSDASRDAYDQYLDALEVARSKAWTSDEWPPQPTEELTDEEIWTISTPYSEL